MAHSKVTIKKWNGDDLYSWAVFVDGQVQLQLTGLNRSQAQYYRDQLKRRTSVAPSSSK